MKELARALAVIVVLNVIGAVGYAGYAGFFEGPRLSAAWAALRKSPAEMAGVPTTTSAPTSAESEPMAHAPTSRPAAAGESSEVAQIELDQRDSELKQQWEQIRAARLQLLRDREAMEHEKTGAMTTSKEREKPVDSEGYKKSLEYLSSIKPKQAKDFIRMKKDADAVAILMALEPRVGRKIIDACKTAEERQWMGRLLEELRQRDDRQAEALAASPK